MKTPITTICILLLFQLNIKAEIINKKVKRWGYVYHLSKLKYSYLKKNLKNYDIISMTGYRLNLKGRLTYRTNNLMKNIISIAKKNYKDIYPLITFQNPSTGHKILNSNKLMERSNEIIDEKTCSQV